MMSAGNLDQLDNKDRMTDLETGLDYGVEQAHISIVLPPNLTPESLDPDVKQESQWSNYKFSYRLDGATLHADSEAEATVLRVPRADIAAYVDFLRGMWP